MYYNYQSTLQKEYITGIQKLIEKFPNERFVLRPHPSEKIETYQKIFSNYKNVEINIGDRVITSGFSKIYPPKLPVGTVSGVYDERGSYQKVVNVNIQNDFESIQNVFVVISE